MYDGRSHERQFLTAWLSRARSPPLLSMYPVAQLFIGSRTSCSPRALPGYSEKLHRRNRPFPPAGAPPAEACPFFLAIFERHSKKVLRSSSVARRYSPLHRIQRTSDLPRYLLDNMLTSTARRCFKYSDILFFFLIISRHYLYYLYFTVFGVEKLKLRFFWIQFQFYI